MKHAKTKQVSVVDSKFLRMFVGLALVVGLMPSVSFAGQETVTVRDAEGAAEEIVVEQSTPPADAVEAADEEEPAELATANVEAKTERVDKVMAIAGVAGESEEIVLATSEGDEPTEDDSPEGEPAEGEATNDAAIAISLPSAPLTQTVEADVDYYNGSVTVSVTVTDADFASGTVKVMRNGSVLDGKTTSINDSGTAVEVSLNADDTADGAVTIEVETLDNNGASKTYSYGQTDVEGCSTKANDQDVANEKLAVNAAPQVEITWAPEGVGSVHGSKAIFQSTAVAGGPSVVATITVTDKTLFDSPADNADEVTITADGATLGEWTGSDGVYTRTATFAFADGETVSVSVNATDAGTLSGAGSSSITMESDADAPKLDVQYYFGTNEAEAEKAALYSGSDADATSESVTVQLIITEANPLNAGNIVVDFGDGSDAVDLSDEEPNGNEYTLTRTYATDGRYVISVTGNNPEGGACDAAGNPLEESGAISGKYHATVAVDTEPPVVDVRYFLTGDESAGDLVADNGEYSANEPITAEITVADTSFDTDTEIVIVGDAAIRQEGGKTWIAQNGAYVAHVDFPATLDKRNEYELSFVAKDALDNSTAYPGDNGETDKIVVDTTAPRLTVEFPNAKNYQNNVRYYDGLSDVVANVTVADDTIVATDIAITADSDNVGAWDTADSKRLTTSVKFPKPASGETVSYELAITGEDAYGNQIISGDEDSGETKDPQEQTVVDPETHQYATTVVLDNKAPVLSVEWNNTSVRNGKYYAAKRTATITVVESNFDPDFISITTTGSIGEKWTGEGDAHTIEVSFANDGSHKLSISGTDLAGNKLTGGEVDQGKYDSEFVIDTVAPVVTLTMSQSPSNSASGVDYYRTGTKLNATIAVDDENFDPANDETEATVITPTGTFAEGYDKNNWSGASYTVTFTPNDAYDAAPSNTLTATVYDLAGNSTTVAYGDKPALSEDNKVIISKVVDAQGAEISGNANFTLDVTAPVIVPGNGSDVPNRVYSGNYSDTLVFYKDATTLRIVVNDAIGIDGITGLGSDYAFDAVSGTSGDKTWTMDVSLRDGKEFTNEFLLTATDLAQNVRAWAINPQTLDVKDAIGSSAANLPLYGDEPELYPVALILDTTAPTISLSGATPGAYYNSTQAITTAIEELNFKYLKQYDGSQVITVVTKKAGNATRAVTTTTIPVSSFTGSESSYSNVFQAADDGHYSFAAHITDPAGNEASASLGEFTIDKTAPVASISWDNTDVRNDKYYAAARTATITVVEHNFDASRISITTTGSIGAWMDNGDTHTIQVSFGSDGTYNLDVTGTDLAGNALNEITEPEFVVDMTVPNIEISLVENGYAYGRDVAVAPVITFTDEANFDPNGTSYTLTGSKNGEVSYSAGSADSDNSRTVTYGDFGADRGGSYDPNADDIYTLHATMTDLAGNAAAEQTVTFSVNRYGSTYRILEGDYTKENAYLDEAPEVRIQEINVSGTVPEKNSIVVSPEGASQKYLTMNTAAASTGYTVTESTSTEGASRGWSTYTYSIAPGNFDHDARYHVVVTSEDWAANRNTSTGYFNRDKGESDAKAEVVFILDENAPEVVGLHVTGGELDEYYEGEFSVHEDIGIASVEVTLAGESLEVEDLGGNNYAFKAPSRSFAPSRELVVTATDLSDKAGSDEIDLTSLLIALPIGIVVVVGVAAFFVVRAVRRPRVRVK